MKNTVLFLIAKISVSPTTTTLETAVHISANIWAMLWTMGPDKAGDQVSLKQWAGQMAAGAVASVVTERYYYYAHLRKIIL